MIEGVDYSRTAHFGSPSVVALQANGKHFAGRYAVNDWSPQGRGIHPDEYARLKEGKIDVFLYWEGVAEWMLGGYAAGVSAALNANANIAACGMPPETPIYFAHDIDPQPRHFPLIDACLAGAAAIVGPERVGIYGGWLIIDHCRTVGNAKWFCQTLAWAYGRGWHPAAHLHQYGFNVYIDGTNVDLVRSIGEHYGQASDFEDADPPPPQPGKITWDPTTDAGIVQYKGDDILVGRTKVICTRGANLYTAASAKRGKIVGKTKVGREYLCVGSTESGWLFIELEPGYVPRAVRSAFRPLVPRPQDYKKFQAATNPPPGA